MTFSPKEVSLRSLTSVATLLRISVCRLFEYQKSNFKSAAHNLSQKSWNRAAVWTWRKIFKYFWIPDYSENIDETAVVTDEEEELEKEGDQEDTENGNKGTEKIDDEENHTTDFNSFLLLVWACTFS